MSNCHEAVKSMGTALLLFVNVLDFKFRFISEAICQIISGWKTVQTVTLFCNALEECGQERRNFSSGMKLKS